jgi:large subunit ribosomal protein L35
MKTRKSVKKRFKITKKGKVMRRIGGQDHARAKKTGDQIRHKRKWVEVSKPLAKRVKKLINK